MPLLPASPGPAASAEGDALCWYACLTRARHEKQVELRLRQRDLECYLPLVTRVRQWKDRSKQVRFALYPGYVFARCPPDRMQQVLSVPGIASVVRQSGLPVPIPDADIDNVRRFAQALAATPVEPAPAYFPERGEVARIIAGPFRGVEGIVVGTRGRGRVLVGLKAIGQALEINVDAHHIGPKVV